MAANAVIAAIPYYRCQPYVRRAVESLLAQTHRNLTVVVLNDADHDTPPWPALDDITDPRLVRFDLAANRGPYFAIQVTLLATSAPYLLIQDADDWSHPERVARLLDILKQECADLAISAEARVRVDSIDRSEIIETLWQEGPQRQLDERRRYRAPHHGLFRARTLHDIGGYYGGFRLGYDSLLTNLTLMVGRVAFTRQPLYYYTLRSESLTTASSTGLRSEQRGLVNQELSCLYKEVYASQSQLLHGKLSSARFLETIRCICARHVTAEDHRAMHEEKERLAIFLAS